ncbi:ATP-dependent helicase HrpB [Reichenbachiella carrageenanivorans]|uniref:ATP-dependent helicase HrpB n=1 Tax=Reichenbachiella carrageenanivorans TaxID=2979869 RepID=A0ABY6CYH9_9BACT|nr:ATP-dependent helicase HrpB [Reichenbachiella carrageenanivorans]UXX78967.1 ATP-dependent helicase HrpB [Reichenbachiella carrageenanivorans]
MAFNYKNIDLPIVASVKEIQSNFENQNTQIVNAPPGAGKSTLLPLAFLGQPWLNGKKILMLEPRRLAARTVATRMAELLGEKTGQTVGYRIRFENKVSDQTQIEVLTEGILTRMIHSDNSLEGVGLVIFDEFHERSIHADVALALCREAQQILRPDLKILIMSATLDMPQLTSLLQCPVVKSEGRQYPVEVKYTGDTDMMMLPELTARIIMQATKENEGDALVFFPGQGEIRKCEEILRGKLKGFAIHPLYGQLPHGKQMAAIMPDKNGKRKVVLATSIAETSLTIEGIKIVVDTGYGRTSKFDPKSGLSRLHTIQISKDSADQRAGRAGRLSAGACYRMWSKATQDRLDLHGSPEILEVDLSSLALDLAKWGIMDPNQLTWLTPPPPSTMKRAMDSLHELHALNNGKITPHGEQMHSLPCHPRIAHMLIEAKAQELLHLATDIAALIEERDPLGPEAGIDINERIIVLRRLRDENRLSRKFSRIEKIADSYRKLFHLNEIDNSPIDPYETGLLLAQAYPERIAFARPGNNAQFKLSNGKIAMAGHRDDLAHESWLAIAHLDDREGMGKIFMASPLNPKDLAPMVKSLEVIKWDTRDGGLIANKELRIGSIVLQSVPLPDPDIEHLEQAIYDAIKSEGQHLLNWDEEVTQWQNRILSLKKWHPQGQWPDVSQTYLLASNEEWLKPYLSQIKRPEDLKKINLKEVLHHHLPFDQQAEMEKLAPQKIEVPTGSHIKIQYFSDGAQPVLAVRLQEVFGLLKTPKVNADKTPLLMHLLSPGFKPVQVTSDLKSFWNNAYFEVRKELKRRYPKHAWPENPLEATAVRGVDRSKNKKT